MTDQHEPDLEKALTDYAESMEGTPPPGFADWVMRSVATEPLPRRGLIASLALLLTAPGPYRFVAQAALVVAILAAGVGSAVAIGQISGLLPDQHVLTSPSPLPSQEPQLSPSVEPSPSLVVEPSPTPTESPATPSAEESPEDSGSGHGGDESETPQPTETPEPS